MRKKSSRFSNSPKQLWSKMIVFFFVLIGVGLSIVAASQNQSLIQRAQESVKPACPQNQVFFPIPGISNSTECLLNGVPGYFICNATYVYVPPSSGSLPTCVQPPTQSGVLACPTGVQNVTAGAQNSTTCLLSGLLTAYCNAGYIPRANTVLGGPSTCVPSSCTADKCVWGANQDGSPICKDSGTVLGCNIGGCKSGQQLTCTNGTFTCVSNSSACPIATPMATPTSNNCPAGICVYKAPASSASYACGMAGLMPGSGTCAQADNTCCVTSTYVAKCTWDASMPENICTRDGVNRLYVSGKPTRPACCGGLTENGQGTCECKTVTATPVSTSPLTPTTTPKPTPQLSSTCSTVAFVDGFNDTNLSTKFRVLGSGSVRSGVRISSVNAPVNNALELSIQPTNVSQSISAVGVETVQLVQGVFNFKLNLHKFLSSGQPFTFMADNGKTTYGVRIENGGNKETYKLTSEQRTTGTNLVSGQQTYYLSASTRPVLFIERTGGGTIRVGYTVGAASPVTMQTFAAISGDFRAKLTLAGPTSTITLDRFTVSCL